MREPPLTPESGRGPLQIVVPSTQEVLQAVRGQMALPLPPTPRHPLVPEPVRAHTSKRKPVLCPPQWTLDRLHSPESCRWSLSPPAPIVITEGISALLAPIPENMFSIPSNKMLILVRAALIPVSPSADPPLLVTALQQHDTKHRIPSTDPQCPVLRRQTIRRAETHLSGIVPRSPVLLPITMTPLSGTT